ncbi:hypothetical protein J6O48_00045 [bacterium]|nr:hypothetical protein [bacterium]
MGFLLMQYEYQRATSQYNLCERTGIRLNDQLEKYTKRIENMQSLFSKAESRLENNWNNYSNNFNSIISAAQNNIGATVGAAAINNFVSQLGGIRIGGVALGSFISYSGAEPTTAQETLAALSQLGAQAKAIMTQLIQNAKEADIEKLHAQQNAQLEPISEKESDIQGKVNLNDTLTTIWQQRRDNAKERLGQDIENGVSKYGLK